jgi:hypothetical protein
MARRTSNRSRTIKARVPLRARDRRRFEQEQSNEEIAINSVSDRIKTVEQALEFGQVNLDEWEVERSCVNFWESACKNDKTGLMTPITLYQVKVWLRKKRAEVVGMEALLELIRDGSPVVPRIRYPGPGRGRRRIQRCAELDIFDPHLGLHCFKPDSDHYWTLEDCEQIAMWAVDRLLQLLEPYAPLDHIVFPFGNDFLHHDNLDHTTTGHTAQPEGLSYNEIFVRGEKLAIAMIERMKEVAPVKVKQIPGNHDRQSSFALGRVLSAWYHNDPNVEVDASASPYKFHRFGTTLIGYDHGHSVRPIRLAALMANECRQDWAETTYREWHLGDQHRKGSSKPSTHEEQGVSVEYLTGLTPPNAWHRLKAFNWQKRGATAFVYDYDRGPEARLQVNLNSYNGLPTGISTDEKRKYNL